jgi:carboxylate-amine ligase
MSRTGHLRLFEGYGIELEYMLVDCSTLRARPMSDQLLHELSGDYSGDADLGEIELSNELVMHVLEMKTNGPAPDLVRAAQKMQETVRFVNQKLAKRGVMLMPSAMHPTFDPNTEMKLWPHDNAEIYSTFNQIFNCQGHGWSNLQSIHINLPFWDDAEFRRLHSAIRLVLPLIPAIAASSPIVEGKVTDMCDNRLRFYQQNQKRVPAIAGRVIPDVFKTESEYQKLLANIYSQVACYDIDGLLNDEWLNSRGAIARFQRHAVEIRVTDIQECPANDFAIIGAVVELVHEYVDQSKCSIEQQEKMVTEKLFSVFQSAVATGGQTVVQDKDYLQVLGFSEAKLSAKDLWTGLIERLSGRKHSKVAPFKDRALGVVKHGTLAERLKTALGKDVDLVRIHDVYRQLSRCLERGEVFLP